MSGPAVSAIVPVRNGARFMREALDSIVGQTRPPEELIVVDGGSTDGSVQIARSYPQVTLVEQGGSGLGDAWNQGVERSSGELVAFLDSDDRWLPHKLERQLELLAERPRLAGAIGIVKHYVEPGFDPPPGFRPELLGREDLATMPGTLLVHRWVFERIGMFDNSYAIAVDVDWFARLRDAGLELGVLDELVTEKRAHDANLSHSDTLRNNMELARALRASIERKRAK